MHPTIQALRQIAVSCPNYELTARQLTVLAYAATNEPGACEVRKMSVLFGLSKPAITRAMSRLEADGLAQRSVWGHDRRIVQLKVTTRGRKAIAPLLALGGERKAAA